LAHSQFELAKLQNICAQQFQELASWQAWWRYTTATVDGDPYGSGNVDVDRVLDALLKPGTWEPIEDNTKLIKNKLDATQEDQRYEFKVAVDNEELRKTSEDFNSEFANGEMHTTDEDGKFELGKIIVSDMRRSMLRDTGLHESLDTVPTPTASQCIIKRMHADVKVYSQGGVHVRTLDEETYAYHWQRGELDIAPPWMKSYRF
jgi:hypothetical protein